MATDRRRPPHGQRRSEIDSPAPQRRRIPLPPLPPPRSAGSTATTRSATGATPAGTAGTPAARAVAPTADRRGLSREESDLLVAGPDHDERTGARGVTILNELVDEIQKGLDSEITRHTGTGALAIYRQTVACSLVVAPDAALDNAPQPDPVDRRHE